MICINSRLCIWCASDPSSIHPETLRVCEATFCFCHKNLSLLEMPLTIFFFHYYCFKCVFIIASICFTLTDDM